MRLLQAACIAALILVPSSSHAAGKSRSLGASPPSSHSVKVRPPLKSIAPHHHAFRRYPIFAVPYTAPDDSNYEAFAELEIPSEPSRVLNCQRTWQTVIVPSVIGGTREITIRRC
jgi:hypothetical protein